MFLCLNGKETYPTQLRRSKDGGTSSSLIISLNGKETWHPKVHVHCKRLSWHSYLI